MSLLRVLSRVALMFAAGFAVAGSHAAEDAHAADTGELAELLAEPVYGSSRLAGASKYSQDLAEAPTLVYVRTAGEIRTQGYRTLADVLESMPGVNARFDRVYTHVGVRGINPPGDFAGRLLVLIDGVRVNEAIYDSATLGREFPLDIGLIERVEFIPGPGSSLYGSNAVLGVVNVITRGPSQLPGLQASYELSSGHRRKLGATWGGEAGPVRLLAAATRERAGGHDLYFPEFDAPATHGGWAIGQEDEIADKLYLKARWSDLTLSLNLSDRTQADPTASYGTLFDTRSTLTDRYFFGDLAYSHAFGSRHEMYARLGVARYRYLGSALYDDTGLVVPAQVRSDGNWTSGEVRYVWSGWSRQRVLLGFEFQDNTRQVLRSVRGEPAPIVYSDLSFTSSRHSVFVNDEWQVLDSVRINVGLRVDHRLDRSTTTTPRAAALWSPTPQWTFKLQRGSAFREPNLYESQYVDSVTTANRALRIESLSSTEVSALWRPQRQFEASVSAYDLRIRDLITLVPLDDGTSQYWNLGRARSRGVQTEATWQAGHGVQWRASWSRQSARDETTGAPLSDAPRSLVKLSLMAPLPANGWRLGANLRRVGERSTLSGAVLDPVTLLNLQLTLAPPGAPWNLGFGIVNATDRRYVDPGGPEHVQDTLPQLGREFVLRLGYTF